MLSVFERLSKLTIAVQIVFADSLDFCATLSRSRTVLAAENLFLRKQLALFQEREKKATRTTAADRFVLTKLAHFFDWRSALIIVKPATLVGRHRTSFRRFWRWKSRAVGRPPISVEIRRLIRRMAAENPTWGEERIAEELLLKLHVRLSPRTVGKYIQQQPRSRKSRDQRWSTFLRNHAHGVVACDFFVSVTASFRILYVFVALEVGSRRLVHFNVTEHPTAEWTLQQLREVLPGDSDCKFLLHDRHKTFAASLDGEVASWGIHILRSPVRMPTANAHCERLIGTIHRECLDYVIPLNSGHLRRIFREWVSHYNTGCPHQSLGPGIPDRPQPNVPTGSPHFPVPFTITRHCRTDSRRLASRVPMGRCRMSPRLDFLRRTGASASQIDWQSRLAATRIRLKRVTSPEYLAVSWYDWRGPVMRLWLIVPLAAAAFAQDPAQIFKTTCAGCHGLDSMGGEHAPAINLGRPDTEVLQLIQNGIPSSGMPAFGKKLTSGQIQNLITYLRRLQPIDTWLAVEAKLPFDLRPSEGSWPSYNGDYTGRRYSSLKQITPENISALRAQWVFHSPNSNRLEVTPLVVNGTMFVTSANDAFALDARTGRELWHYKRSITEGLIDDASAHHSRGAAIWGSRLYIETDNAHLLCLDAQSGKLLWDVPYAEGNKNYGATSVPLVVKDKVLVGTSGGDDGVRGFLAAFDAATGKEAWRFWTIPGPGEFGSSSWPGDMYLRGGATTWMPGAYDPDLNTIYWTTGNPAPDFDGTPRPGDDLYTDCVLALDPDTGKLKWYFQFTPHDLYDYDATQTPVLIDTPRKLLVQANRNGFVYVLDRTNGKFLSATPFVKKLNWATGIDKHGRPIRTNVMPSKEGTVVCPDMTGATNWFSPSYNPATRLLYFMALENCQKYFLEPQEFAEGNAFYATGAKTIPGERGQKILTAFNPETGQFAWRYPQAGEGNSWAGTMTTASGLVFFGNDSEGFEAVDAKTGKPLWRFQTGQSLHASPMSYSVNGNQYVAIAAGSDIFSFALAPTLP